MARWHRLETIVDLAAITRADAAVEHDLSVAICNVAVSTAGLVTVVVDTHCTQDVIGDNGFADGEEVRAESANEPLDKDLEHRCSD